MFRTWLRNCLSYWRADPRNQPSDRILLRGQAQVKVRDVETGKLIHEEKAVNRSNGAWFEELRDMVDPEISSDNRIDAEKVRLGSDGSSSVSGHLGNPVGTVIADFNGAPNGGYFKAQGLIGKTQLNGNTLAEAGLYDATDGVGINRIVFDSSVKKTNTKEVTILFEHEFLNDREV